VAAKHRECPACGADTDKAENPAKLEAANGKAKAAKRLLEDRQLCADAAIDLAQLFERRARMLKDRARLLRAGQSRVAYQNLPEDAGPHMRGRIQAAIDDIKADASVGYQADAILAALESAQRIER
jgi:hypothetical protein